MDLSQYREQIDQIDDELIQLFARRMETAAQIAQWKRQAGKPVMDAGRERAKLLDVMEKCPEEFKDYAVSLYSLLFELSRSYQHRILDSSSALTEQITAAIENTDPLFPKTATVACKTIPTWNLESEMSAEAAGLSIPYEVSDPDSVGWRLESDADWIAVDSDVVIDVNTNPSSSSRTGHVSLICDAVETNYVVATCTVMQAAGAATELDPSISVLQDTFSVPATTTSVTQLFSSKNLTGLTATVTGALEGATVNLNEVSRTIVVNFRANTT